MHVDFGGIVPYVAIPHGTRDVHKTIVKSNLITSGGSKVSPDIIIL